MMDGEAQIAEINARYEMAEAIRATARDAERLAAMLRMIAGRLALPGTAEHQAAEALGNAALNIQEFIRAADFAGMVRMSCRYQVALATVDHQRATVAAESYRKGGITGVPIRLVDDAG